MWMPGWILSLVLLSATAGPGGGEVQRLVLKTKNGDKVVPADEVDREPRPLQTDIEWPSADLYRRGQGGTVVLRLIIDDQGAPARVSIEESSGIDLLDLSAVVSAMKWRYTPAADKGRPVASEALQPVTFRVLPEYSLTRTTGRARDAWFEQRRAGKAARPVTDASGRFPGVIPDELPIGVSAIDEAREMLGRHAVRTDREAPAKGVVYVLRDEEGYSEWLLTPTLPDGTRVLVRSRMVGDAGSSWMVQSMLCEGPQEHCAAARERFARGRAAPQKAGGPYPVPPVAGAAP